MLWLLLSAAATYACCIEAHRRTAMPARLPMPTRHLLASGQTRLVRVERGAVLRLESGLVSVRLPMSWLDGAMIEPQARLHAGSALALDAGWIVLTAHAPAALLLESRPPVARWMRWLPPTLRAPARQPARAA